MSTGQKSPVPDEAARAKTSQDAPLRRGDASGDSPKRQGDKLGAGTSAPTEPSKTGVEGDSAKPHGDKLGRAVKEAAGG